MSLHQPRSNIFNLVDNLCVLSHGKQVYTGAAVDLIPFLEGKGVDCPPHYNPADLIIDTVAEKGNSLMPPNNEDVPMSSSKISSTSSSSSSSFPRNLLTSTSYASSFLTQFYILSIRNALHNLRSPALLHVHYLVIIVLAVVLGYVFHNLPADLNSGGVQNRFGVLFFIPVMLAFLSNPVLEIFLKDRVIYVRERAMGTYRPSAYFASLVLWDMIVLRIVPTLVLGLITYHLIGLRVGSSYLFYYLALIILSTMCASSMFMSMSAISPSFGVASLLSTLLLFLFLLFGGFLVNVATLPEIFRWIPYTSFIYHAYHSLLVNEFNGSKFNFNPQGFDTNLALDGTVYLSQLGVDVTMFDLHFYVLLGMVAYYLIFAYFALRFVVVERR
eukprot:TRINITY_DN10477_c0_g1_i1.p1 TRINITY_DN10477_c0_g1~~TRINITY_DN10477_c0_g1_i1.p1  ORF type:complete len:439 (+),score=66.88 TRINITY_DN10477_c0_g1_i1:160-1317(+)